MSFVRVAVQTHKVNLLSVDSDEASNSVEYLIPVDSKLEDFTVSVSGNSPNVSIRDPLGRWIVQRGAEEHWSFFPSMEKISLLGSFFDNHEKVKQGAPGAA